MKGAALTSRQQQQVLETIAVRMVTVDRVLMILQTKQRDAFDTATLLDAAQFMAETVGAMADDATGGGALGDMNTWLHGVLFGIEAGQGGAE